MTPMEKQAAAARSEIFLQRFGKAAADRVWGRILNFGYGPDAVFELVDDECESLRLCLVETGASERDIPNVIDVFRAIVIREGKQLAILFAMEAGGRA